MLPSPIQKVSQLRKAVRAADERAFLVEPRVVRRIIREIHGYSRLSTIPHGESLVVNRRNVLEFAHSDELGLQSFDALPEWSILLAQPEEHELERQDIGSLLQLKWSHLFHGMIDLRLQRMVATWPTARSSIQQRIDRLGQVEFDEAHAVLISEHRVFDADSHVEAYCEFAAIFLELYRFHPDLIPVWFPSLANTDHVLSVLSDDIDEAELYAASQLASATQPSGVPEDLKDEERVAQERLSWADSIAATPSPRRFQRQMRKRTRWSERGNSVAAAVAAVWALRVASTDEERSIASAAAMEETAILADRLHAALQFRESELEPWRESLWELVRNSTNGFWNSDKRLLYDLQKVCLDHERTIYQVDIVKWVVSRGKRPLRRALTNIREVMMAKHLASSASRLPYVRLSGPERSQLAKLLHEAADLAEEQMRQRMRSAVQETIADVGLLPKSVPEKVAFDKMVEESLDCITERGYLTMGYLRDAISRNDLKLPDLTDPRDLIRGDHLLRTDDRLDVSLDGVYRRGEFYLRWLQVTSSLFFGTRTGRLATLFLAIPFAGGVVIVVGLHHLIGIVAAPHNDEDEPLDVAGAADGDVTAETTQSTSSDENEELENEEVGNEEVGNEEVGNEEVGNEEVGNEEVEVDVAAADEATSSEVSDGAGDLPDAAGPDSAATDAASVETADLAGDTEPSNIAEATDTDDGSGVESDAADSSDDGEVPEIAEVGDSAAAKNTENEAVDSIESATVEMVGTEEHMPHPLLPLYEWIGDKTVPLSVTIGFLLMALIHLPAFRSTFFVAMRTLWKTFRSVVWEFPKSLLAMPWVQDLWRQRWFVRLRRHVTTPLLVSWLGLRILPWLLGARYILGWKVVLIVATLASFAMNLRFWRDAEELTAEWLANAWYDLRSRFLMAVFNWVIDFFKWLLNLLERFIYAVDEWLRFHSGETWITIMVKAVLGVIWSFVSFLIRIYVNLLIEPTLHPVKHFPVVTVAHKIFLPWIIVVEITMREFLTPYLGIAIAGPITWFNIVFLPGIFGFLVWELKENWRLYEANRLPVLKPVIIGSHGEDGGRLLKPGFHSGTLPKLFGKLRTLERRKASFKRFTQRRAVRESLLHVERDIQRFIERDLIQLLHYCPPWEGHPITCRQVSAASNSFLVELTCDTQGSQSAELLFQEQSRWLVATIRQPGWLENLTPELLCSFETAISGVYRKAGVDLVREQLERTVTGHHPYDVCNAGIVIWPERQFEKPVTLDLSRRHQLRPVPSQLAAGYGIVPVSRESAVYADSKTLWSDWKQVWEVPENSESSKPLPLACLPSARVSLTSLK